MRLLLTLTHMQAHTHTRMHTHTRIHIHMNTTSMHSSFAFPQFLWLKQTGTFIRLGSYDTITDNENSNYKGCHCIECRTPLFPSNHSPFDTFGYYYSSSSLLGTKFGCWVLSCVQYATLDASEVSFPYCLLDSIMMGDYTKGEEERLIELITQTDYVGWLSHWK